MKHARLALASSGHAAATALRVTGNVMELLAVDAARSWLRNLRTVTPALGSMGLLLLLVGLGDLSAVAVRTVLQQEARDASVLHVYLKADAAQADVDHLRSRLLSDDRVTSVRFVSADEALREARSRPGLDPLIQAAGDNPFPAGFEVRVRHLSDIGPLALTLASEPAVDPGDPSSYDAATYQRLQGLLAIVGAVGLGLLLVLALVAAAVTANAVRAAILARRDDVTTMRLVGASGWLMRGPFVLEGALTGLVAGLLGGAVLLAMFAGAQWASVQTLTELLPGVGWGAALAAAGLLPLAGVGLGSAASVVGVRGLSR